MLQRITRFLPLSLLLMPQLASACAACGCTLSRDWLGPQSGSESGWAASLAYDYINQSQPRQGTHNLTLQQADQVLNPPALGVTGQEVEEQTATRTTTVQFDYNTETWGISAQLPLVDRYHTTLQAGLAEPEQFNVNQYRTLGDARLLGKFSIASEGRYGLVLGVKLPTGSTDQRFNDPPAGRVDPSLQPGTGSTDVIVGGYYADMMDALAWFAQATMQHAISHQDGYTPGDALVANAGLRFGGMGQRVTPLLQFNLVHRDKDSGSQVNVKYDGSPLSGGNLAYLAPGLAISLGKGFSAYSYVQIPLYQDVRGVQLTPRYIASVGVRKNF